MRIRPPFVAEYESTILGLRTSTLFRVALVLLLLANLSLTYLYKSQIDRTLAAHQDALYTVGAALDARGQHDEALAVYKKALAGASTASPQSLPPSARKAPGEGLGLPAVKGAALPGSSPKPNLKGTSQAKGTTRAKGTTPASVAASPRRNPPASRVKTSAPSPSRSASMKLRYAVQVGAFRKRSAAERVARRLNGSYPKSQISPMETGRGILYKVQLPTRTKSEAQNLVARLRREQAMQTFIVSLR